MRVDITFADSTPDNNHDIETVGELKAAYGAFIRPDDLQFADDLTDVNEDEFCLCGVDLPAILQRAGVAYVVGDFGYEVETWNPPSAPSEAFED